MDVDKAVEYVVSCMNFDGGFGRVPGSESHAGQVSITTSIYFPPLQKSPSHSLDINQCFMQSVHYIC